MTLERARSHDGWRARRPRPLAAIASRAIKKFRVSATLRKTDEPPPWGLGSRNSHFYRPNAEVLTGAASAIAVGKRRRCTSRSQSGGPQPTGDRERNRPPVAPELGKQTRAEGQEMTPALTRQVRRDLVSARVPDRPESEHLSIRVLAPSLLTIRPKQEVVPGLVEF